MLDLQCQLDFLKSRVDLVYALFSTWHLKTTWALMSSINQRMVQCKKKKGQKSDVPPKRPNSADRLLRKMNHCHQQIQYDLKAPSPKPDEGQWFKGPVSIHYEGNFDHNTIQKHPYFSYLRLQTWASGRICESNVRLLPDEHIGIFQGDLNTCKGKHFPV